MRKFAKRIREAGEVSTKKSGSVYTSVVYTSILPLVGVYTWPGRWGAHYTTVHYPPREKNWQCICILLDYTSPASLDFFEK